MIATFREDCGCETIHAWGMTETSPLGTADQIEVKRDRLDAGGHLFIRDRTKDIMGNGAPNGTGKKLKNKLREQFGDLLIGKGA